MCYTDSCSLRNSLRNWINLDDWSHPFAVTLTLKQGVWVEGERGRFWVPLTPIECSQNLRHFLNVLNRRVYGPSSQRYSKRISVLPVLEGGDSKRLHYHLVIDCPRTDLLEEFPALVTGVWKSTMWGYEQAVITPCDDEWIAYMTKLRDKPDFGMSIDWMNCTIPA